MANSDTIESRAQFKLIKLQAKRDSDMEVRSEMSCCAEWHRKSFSKNLLFPLYWVAVAHKQQRRAASFFEMRANNWKAIFIIRRPPLAPCEIELTIVHVNFARRFFSGASEALRCSLRRSCMLPRLLFLLFSLLNRTWKKQIKNNYSSS